MRIVPTTLLAGVACVALAGIAVAHTLTVRLPDGTTEQIEYSGNVAPQVSFVPTASVAAPDWAAGPNSPFALMQQISAEMDRETAAMLRQIQAIAMQPLPTADQPIAISASNLPRGAESYSFVSTVSPNGFCSQSMQIISNGPGQKPQVVTHRSGNCGPAAGTSATNAAAAPDETPATMPAQPRTDTYRASAEGNSAYARMFHQASW